MMLLQKISRRFFFFLSYYRKPRWDTGTTPPELIDFIQTHPPGRAIDLGCGTGTNVITLAQHGWQVIGIDFIPRAVKKARQKIKEANVEASVFAGDVTQLKIDPGPFDLALDIGCYHNLKNNEKQAYEHNLQKVIAYGGTFLLYGFLHTSDRIFGIREEDLVRLQFFMRLDYREDGTDLDRPSAWFTFTKMTNPSGD